MENNVITFFTVGRFIVKCMPIILPIMGLYSLLKLVES